ncbi:MAG: tRNA (guanosine(46)-N7)-methyltransferase TrmB, partial [Epsilonproteobacteria bacterium]|nr:tRNA (guanosine(46)-N7)-methyltransferase TrmB [Campylobacterota bacterium]
ASKPEIDDGIKKFLQFFACQIKEMLKNADIVQNNLSSSGRFPSLIDSEYEMSGPIAQFVDWKKSFGNDKDLIVEIGFGRGDFLFKLRQFYPECSLIGMETQPKSIYLTKRKLMKANESGIKLINISALSALTYLFKPGSISKIFINFPVPWPKKRQSNKRLVSGEFAKIAFNCLKKGGVINLATDSEDYFRMSKLLFAESGFMESSVDEIYKTEKIGTKYENKWLNEGRAIYICSMKKHAAVPQALSKKDSSEKECKSASPAEFDEAKEITLPDVTLKLKDRYTTASGNRHLYVIDAIGHNFSEQLFFDGRMLNVSTFIMLPSISTFFNI